MRHTFFELGYSEIFCILHLSLAFARIPIAGHDRK